MGISAMSGSVNTQVPDYYQKLASGKKTDMTPEETQAASNAGVAITSVVQTKIETENSGENQKDANVSKTPDSEMSDFLKKIQEDSVDRLITGPTSKDVKALTMNQGRELEDFPVENRTDVILNMASQLD